MNETFGQELRRTRRAVGMSLSALAEQVSYSKSHLSRIESGAKAPSVPLARRCDDVLGADGRLAALAPPASNTSGTNRTSEATEEVRAPGRVALLTATVAALSATLDDASTASRLAPEATAEAFEQMLGEFRALGQSHPPVMLTTLMGAQVAVLHELAMSAAGPDRTTYLRLTARYCDYLGWMRQEAGRDDEAMHWIRRARTFAAAAGDQATAAYCRIRQGEIALYRGDSLSTVALAQSAQAATADARVRALGALTEAQGHALHGDAPRCYEALDRATAWIEAAGGDDRGEPEVGSGTMPDPVAFVTAWCLNDLGRPAMAGEILEAELRRLPQHAYRTRARYGARLGLALAGAGDAARMCEVLAAVLDTAAEIDSATVRADLRLVSLEARRWRSSPAVEETIHRLVLALQPRDHRLRA